MPDIPLLDPVVLNKVVQKFTAPQDLALLGTVQSSPSGAPDYAAWDIEKGGRQLAGFNVPGGEATVLNQLGRSNGIAKFAYARSKKVFQGQLLRYLREPGSLNATNAERLVMRELQDMNQSIDLTQELLLWNALRGSSTITYPDGSAVTVNYQFPASHLPSTPANVWSTATPQQIIDNVFNWKRLVATHGRVPATDAYCSSTLIQKIFDSFASNSGSAILTTGGGSGGPGGAFAQGGLLSDRMKDAYYNGDGLPGFMKLNWHPIDEVYTNNAGNLTYFVGDGSSSNQELFLGNYTEGTPWEIQLGKSPDLEAGDDTYGKYTKTWVQHDPSARIVLIEHHYLPVVYRPEQFVYVSNVG